MSESIVPFASPAAKHAAVDRPDMDAITNILAALEGMQTQLQTLTDLVIQQDKRIRELEKVGKSKIIGAVS